jgi:hypothetical protein
VDPPWDQISLSWLQNYVNNIRGNPAVLQGLQGDATRFEMVPVPREILQSLTSRSQLRTTISPAPEAPPSPDAAAQQRIKDREVARSAEALLGLVRTFVNELELGRVDGALATISPNYHDPSGRDAARLRTDLEQLVKDLPDLKIVPFKAEDLRHVGGNIIATVHAAWRTIKKNADKEEHQAETAKVELIFERDHQGVWKIGSLHVL